MINVGAKVWGKRPFFGDSLFLFLMYDVWLRCVFYTPPTPSREGSNASLCFLRCTQRPYNTASLHRSMLTLRAYKKKAPLS